MLLKRSARLPTRLPGIAGACALAALLAAASPALAAGTPAADPLPPFTKLRLAIVQFMPTTGDYKRWDALGGDMQIAADGTLSVPSLGTIPVGAKGPDELAADIAARLKAKLGLVDQPDATIQVVEYPPVFLSGAVMSPGQYGYRPGMTVLQAVALAGGEFRDAATASGKADVIGLQGQLQTATRDILRSKARLARLQAELQGGQQIDFPAELDKADPAVAAIMGQEQAILAAQQSEYGRQAAALDDLQNLFKAEIDALGQKAASIDEQIGETEHQLDGVKDLVDKGVMTASRQTDLERVLSGLRGDRLDNTIATMTARQGLNGAARDLAKLQDDQKSKISVDLQTEEVNLEHLQITETTAVRLLQQVNQQLDDAADKARQQAVAPTYTIVRMADGQPTQIAAEEESLLLPGDVLKVDLPGFTGLRPPPNAMPATPGDAGSPL